MVIFSERSEKSESAEKFVSNKINLFQVFFKIRFNFCSSVSGECQWVHHLGPD